MATDDQTGMNTWMALRGTASIADAYIADKQAGMKADQFEQQAAQMDLQMEEAMLRAKQRQDKINSQLADVMATQEAAFSNSGISLNSGTVQNEYERTREEGRDAKARIQSNARRQQTTMKSQQQGLLSRGEQAELQGDMAAAQEIGKFAMNTFRRGFLGDES